ncbi:C4-dicarboxylate TRAP transporter large permease protein DctM [Neomoorella glycerini]|uniref:C4-dicarboxylate TRAP transporter large permease protein DctM n=1 Tax=Neomoorella glycerini TaxID=55779 RepID=A0A6I5ZS07_9FIRM|nr:TRAP transporter large permease [Moorella glycerini]QGP92772.1 C4-dicarboxylate TRAP transporter large permease protein DctM [Moorella glycerini]
MLTALFISFLVLLILGVPIAFSMAISSVIALMFSSVPLSITVQRMITSIDSFSLMAIPFFMLAGELMDSGGISRRLVRFAQALVGFIRGGLGMSCVVASTIFAGISGSASADTAAIGSILIPSMVKAGYPKGYVASLQACAGSLGPIIPPSLIMIIYGSITGLSIGKLFLAGAIPGILIALGLMLVNYWQAKKLGITATGKFDWRELGQSFIEAIWALIAPIIVVGGILGGVFTATEAGVIVAVYSFVVGYFIYREYSLKDIPRIFMKAAMTTSMVMIIVAGAAIFGWILANEQFPEIATSWLLSLSNNPDIVMLLIIAFLFVVGCFVETIAAAIILIPVLFSIGNQFAYDPIHFATVIAMCLVLGGITPPVGVQLFITSAIARTTMKETLRYLLPFALVPWGVVLLTAYFPALAKWLPGLAFVK